MTTPQPIEAIANFTVESNWKLGWLMRSHNANIPINMKNTPTKIANILNSTFSFVLRCQFKILPPPV
jgi:hypothetical protein